MVHSSQQKAAKLYIYTEVINVHVANCDGHFVCVVAGLW